MLPTVHPAQAQEAFITTWETSSSGESITIPTASSESNYDFEISWGDGTTEQITGSDPDPSHEYSEAGTHTIEITGTFPRIFLNAGSEGAYATSSEVPGGTGNEDNARKLKSINQWGAIEWESMTAAFSGAENMTYNATDEPNLSNVTSIARMFQDATSFNGDIGEWNVHNVADMRGAFLLAVSFNRDISEWDVSNVTDMTSMFSGDLRVGESSFSKDISSWDVSNVEDMGNMFRESNFNKYIGGWNVSEVTDMSNMFEVSSFNKDIGNWDVSNVKDMSGMFFGSSFNKDIESWNVSSVTNMNAMFLGGANFDQNLSEWNVSNVESMYDFLQGNELSTANYDALLIAWSELDLHDGLTFDAGSSQYTSDAEAARQSIIDNHNWTINDAGLVGDASFSVSIEGTRLTPQTRPSESNTPKNAVPYPPDTYSFRDQVEVVRYPADHAVLRARVELNDSFDGSVEDISVEGTINGEAMQTVIRDGVDRDGDSKIDALPFNHYRTGPSTEYADVLLVSSQEIESGAENLPVTVTATTSSSGEEQASEEVSLYYAEHEGAGRPFDPQTDGYRFQNLTRLSFEEVTTSLISFGVLGGFLALYRQLKSYQGRCFGMAGTAGVYFDEPDKKVFSGQTYEQPDSDTKTRQQVTDYHLAQDLTDIGSRLDNPDLQAEYNTAKSILKDENSTPMIGVEYNGDETSRHAILATKLTVLENSDEGIFELNDSNLPGTTYDLLYDISSESIKPSLFTATVTEFATVNVDNVPFFPSGDWYRSLIADLVDGTGKVFAGTFTSGGSSTKTSLTAQSDTASVYVLVENEQGDRAGYIDEGTKVNEIDGAVVEQIVTDSTAVETGTYVALPPGGTYSSTTKTSADGDVRFERATPSGESTPEVDYADSIPFGVNSVAEFDEAEGGDQIKLDEDGDGTIDQTIPVDNSVLPVELAGFKATTTEGNVRLTWQTVSETNNAGFEVQRQKEEDWTQVSFVESRAQGGTTTEVTSYEHVVADLPVGRHRFRLRQVDLDGSSTLTDTVGVRVRMQKSVKLGTVAPNPVSEEATFAFAVKERSETTIRLYDTLGRRVRTVYRGTPRVEEEKRVRVDVSALPSGTYFLRLETRDRSETRQLTVVK